MSTTPAAKLRELLKDFGAAMLVTRTADGALRSRPMAVAGVQDDCVLWLMTQRRSAKLDEVSHDNHVNVTMQSNAKFVSLSGTATPVEDARKVAELWKESWKVWFPGGKDDPTLILLRIQGETGEYWDNSGLNEFKSLFEAGKAYLTGTRPDVDSDPSMHGKVEL